jgi:predicted dithiol-disulfide oxidoreductase (DUF899 family)
MERRPGFLLRAVAMEAGAARIYNEAEWRDALVLVTRGEIELEAVGGEACRFGRGSVLCLDGLPLRALRSRGTEPAVLVTVSRDEFSRGGGSTSGTRGKEARVTEHMVGTREEWEAARKELHEREQELGALDEELAKQRSDLPWVPVEKAYRFETDEGTKTLAELFDGRSQLLIYHLMFGPSYKAACPGCTGLADHFDATLAHLNYRDVTLLAISRAPLEKLQPYKRRMGWQFPYVSSFGSDFNFDFGFAFTEEQMATGELAKTVEEAPQWLADWADNVGTDLASGMAESPGWNVFTLDDGVVYHTYSRTAPDRFLLAPYYHQLLDQVPNGRGADFPLLRHDEYAEGGRVS